ncbi:hypothetical protein [Nocardiopsis dassonvillei]|uniref:hypothetical protein n=1 Tax=Nocardiopsis dassonvillei TaxID=2014 RepID=UPI00142E9226|nr:hypothetical protein [Nocardiopsis dassonvillei]NKY78609.1 hypothetical protein [Nocardiopsis dassonvillei]
MSAVNCGRRPSELLTTADRAGMCADLALALDPGEPEEIAHSDRSASGGWARKAAGY